MSRVVLKSLAVLGLALCAGQSLHAQNQADTATPPPPPSSPPDATPPPSTAPGQGAWLNYDFIPGDRVIWWEDFSSDDVGDFPNRMQLMYGNLEVVNVGGHKYLRTADGGRVFIVLPEALPTRFTVEVRYYSQSGTALMIQTSEGGEYASWGCHRQDGYVEAGGGGARSEGGVPDVGEHDFGTCRFTISDRYVKAYINEHRVANVPTTHVARTDTLIFNIPGGSQEDPTLLTDIRIAAGGRRLYDALSADGRVATQGILFDIGSDHIRGESTPTLKEIGDMLTEHADLRLTIEGHTDNVGAAASNQSLSDGRAAAVRQYLIATFHIDGGRLVSSGFGATRPTVPNTTPEGRQTNRRVELVRI